MYRSIKNFLAHTPSRHPQGWHPLLGVYYLTYTCDFRCPYCSDGAGQPYHCLPDQDIPGDQVIRLLKTMRRYTDYVVITGGEPAQHPDFRFVLQQLTDLKFDGVVLNTNGYTIDKHLDLVAQAVDYLVFSIDTLDRKKSDRWFGVGEGASERIFKNLVCAGNQENAKYEIIISAVATPGNLDDLEELYFFCRARGYRFALCPQLIGVKPHPSLIEDQRYKNIFNLLISEKKKGHRVNGSVAYLEHMRDFKKFTCRPSTVLAVSPGGDVFYPCLEIGNKSGNLLETSDLDLLRKNGRQRFGPEPDCDNRCQSACALGLSLILNRPLSLAGEAWHLLKAGLMQR
jgi:MoaA/NifB/PqqE/SkfB family radical SAM enzyme